MDLAQKKTIYQNNGSKGENTKRETCNSYNIKNILQS